MISQTFEDVFSPQWVKTHIINPTHDLVILRHIIPWQSIIDQLVSSYAPRKGRMGHSLFFKKNQKKVLAIALMWVKK